MKDVHMGRQTNQKCENQTDNRNGTWTHKLVDDTDDEDEEGEREEGTTVTITRT